MEITKGEIKEILDTLPIGYYADRPIAVNISETEPTSFYNLEKDEITFAYSNIEQALANVEDFNRETAIRSVLYHELSHAILTPQNLILTSKTADMVNIFEDERIETLLKDFYHDTDFKGLVKALNGDFTPQDSMDAFFQVVRQRKGKPKFLKKVNEIIYKYAMLGHNCDGHGCWQDGRWTINQYVEDIETLYDEIAKDFNANPQDYKNPLSISNSGNENSDFLDEKSWIKNAMECGYSKEEAEKLFEELKKHIDGNENDNDNEYCEAKEGEGDTECNGEQDKDHNGFGKLIIKKGFGGETISNLTDKLSAIISIFNKKNASGSAFTSYSGVINPKLCGNNDYRFFERKAEARGNNRFGSLHLTLWIDTSGSFYTNKNKTNALIKSLELIEKKNPNFSLDVVHCSCGQRLMPKNNRFIDPDGGNRLTNEVFDLYRQLQKGNTYNYNIFLFDGEAMPDRNNDTNTAFNKVDFNNCLFISDYDNERYLKTLKSAQVILTSNYVNELYDNVFTALHKAFR